MPHRWEDVRITVVRPGPVDQRGACANSIPQDDLKAFSLPSGTAVTFTITQIFHGNVAFCGFFSKFSAVVIVVVVVLS